MHIYLFKHDFLAATQELKVLVDLALISAGESDIETDRISSLYTSCLGFAPLIFDLTETDEQSVSFDRLVKACDPVWKAVQADRTLPEKLVRNVAYVSVTRCDIARNVVCGQLSTSKFVARHVNEVG